MDVRNVAAVSIGTNYGMLLCGGVLLLVALYFFWAYHRSNPVVDARQRQAVGSLSNFRSSDSSVEERFLRLIQRQGLEQILNDKDRIVVVSNYTIARWLVGEFPYHCEFIIEANDGAQHFYDHEQRKDINHDVGLHWSFYNARTLSSSLAAIHRRFGRVPLRQREKILALQAEWESFLPSYMTEDPENPVVILMPLADYGENIAKTMSAPATGAPIQIFTAKELDQRLRSQTDDTLTGFVFFEKNGQ